ncbi:MAG: hypothetical protein DRQ44_15035 [Gammaproteobacteria bacterium]|nr:MAG: hypothetical protein DRQ44_15035 [Gammaproteobacteria bacterium]
MNIWKQIKVMFFLGVMGIMMLHNALPHMHHTHESHGEVTTKAKRHHHAHGHAHHPEHQPDTQDRQYAHQLANHHSDEQDDQDGPRGFLLSFILDNHSHSFHTHEIIQLAKPGNHYILDKHVLDRVVSDSHQSFREFENQDLHRFSLFKRANYDDPLSLDSPLRGPPSIA